MQSVNLPISGKGNIISGGGNCLIKNSTIRFLGNNNKLFLGKGVSMTNCFVGFEGDNNIISIGDGTYLGPNVEFAATEGSNIVIGNDCLIAHSCSFRTTDSHIIMNMEEKRINFVEDIVVGYHVWIGVQSIILKGTNLPDNCIVGARSTVTRGTNAESFCIMAGQPAKIIKRQVKWAH